MTFHLNLVIVTISDELCWHSKYGHSAVTRCEYFLFWQLYGMRKTISCLTMQQTVMLTLIYQPGAGFAVKNSKC
jgi:hypothetical protein